MHMPKHAVSISVTPSDTEVAKIKGGSPLDLPVADTTAPYSLSVVIPTRNEADNIVPLLERLEQATRGLETEVIFVDDSTDHTREVVKAARAHYPFRITLIARPTERRNGLGMAVIEGLQAAQHPWVCVMDGDLQHPPEVIPQLLSQATSAGATLVAASRLTKGGTTAGLSLYRKVISYVLAFVSQLLFPARLRAVSDPLTGFFLVSRNALDLRGLQPEGFKILLEILIRSPNLQVSELPFAFDERHAGESKASSGEAFKLFRQLLRLNVLAHRNFLQFAAVGISGIIVNTLLTALFTELFGLFYIVSATLATQGSSLWNFGLTEGWVFRHRGLQRARLGWRLFGFLAMNNAALVLRGPLIALLVGWFGVHYLIANGVSLLVIVMLRYTVADRLIWRGPALPVAADLKGEL